MLHLGFCFTCDFFNLCVGSISLEKLILAHAFTKNQISKSNSVLQLCEILSSVHTYELITGSNPIKLGIWLKKILLHLNI